MERGEGTLGEHKAKDEEILPNEDDGEEEVGQSKVEKDVCKEKEDERLQEEASCIKAIMESENEMFKPGFKLIDWNTVQFVRSLIIVLFKTFLINPIYRLLVFSPIFLLFVIHDNRAMPYKHNYLNVLQILSTMSLLLLTGCNLVNAFSYMEDITGIPGMNNVVAIIGYTENVLLVVLLPAWLITCKLCTLLEKKKRKYKQD